MTALHHRPSEHPEDKQEATHDGKPVDPDRTEGNAKIVEDPPQDERARKEQAGTDQPQESGGIPGRGVVLQRVRGERDQDRAEPEKLKDDWRARSAGRGRARYRADAAAAAERRVLLADGGGRRCRGTGRGRSSAGILIVAAVGDLAICGRFRLARLRARTCGQNVDHWLRRGLYRLKKIKQKTLQLFSISRIGQALVNQRVVQKETTSR